MFDRIVYTTLHWLMEWSGKINSWSWQKTRETLIEKKRQQENEEYVKELQKKL